MLRADIIITITIWTFIFEMNQETHLEYKLMAGPDIGSLHGREIWQKLQSLIPHLQPFKAKLDLSKDIWFTIYHLLYQTLSIYVLT